MRGITFITAFVAVIFSWATPTGLSAHGGGLDASGCHNDRKRGGYHCHRGSSTPAPIPLYRPAPQKVPPVLPQALASPLPASDETKPKVTIQPDKAAIWQDGRWAVYSYPDEDSCEIGVVPNEGEYLTLTHKPRDETAYLMITNRSATSKSDGETVVLDIQFMSAADFTKVWKNTSFTVRVMPTGTRALVSSALTQDFLSSFASDQFIAVLTKTGALVGGVRLEGSAAAIKQLRMCSLAAADLNPNDPFLNSE